MAPFTSRSDALIFIDDFTATRDEVARLCTSKIERIHVIKGAAAIVRYGASAEGGVIQFYTKRRT